GPGRGGRALRDPAVALVDRNGVYGAPRFYKAARAAGLKALVGAEVTLGAQRPVIPRSTATRDPKLVRGGSSPGSLASLGMTGQSALGMTGQSALGMTGQSALGMTGQ